MYIAEASKSAVLLIAFGRRLSQPQAVRRDARSDLGFAVAEWVAPRLRVQNLCTDEDTSQKGISGELSMQEARSPFGPTKQAIGTPRPDGCLPPGAEVVVFRGREGIPSGYWSSKLEIPDWLFGTARS